MGLILPIALYIYKIYKIYMARQKKILTLQRPIEFEEVIQKSVETFGTGSGHISGLGSYVGRTAIIIILPKGAK